MTEREPLGNWLLAGPPNILLHSLDNSALTFRLTKCRSMSFYVLLYGEAYFVVSLNLDLVGDSKQAQTRVTS